MNTELREEAYIYLTVLKDSKQIDSEEQINTSLLVLERTLF